MIKDKQLQELTAYYEKELLDLHLELIRISQALTLIQRVEPFIDDTADTIVDDYSGGLVLIADSVELQGNKILQLHNRIKSDLAYLATRNLQKPAETDRKQQETAGSTKN